MAADAKRPELKFEFIEITPANLKQLKILNAVLLPVRYSDKFYKDLLRDEAKGLTKLAFVNSNLVGAVCCRVEAPADSKADAHKPRQGTSASPPKPSRLYIMTLGVLAAYRGYGLGTTLLKEVEEMVESRKGSISDVYLHVQINNDDAIKFYKKHGFQVLGRKAGYYRVTPEDAFVLSKRFMDVELPVDRDLVMTQPDGTPV